VEEQEKRRRKGPDSNGRKIKTFFVANDIGLGGDT